MTLALKLLSQKGKDGRELKVKIVFMGGGVRWLYIFLIYVLQKRLVIVFPMSSRFATNQGAGCGCRRAEHPAT